MPRSGPTEKPNVILVLTDHFRRDALGRNTPHLMELAAQGTRFANAYCAAPLCQPSRVALITGLYPSQNGICGNQSEPLKPWLRDDTFMHHLRDAGYFTALVGKHHYIDRYGIGMDVKEDDEELKQYGFDSVFQVVDDGENGHNDDEYTGYLREQGLMDTFRDALLNKNRPGPFRHPFEEDDTADGFIGRNGVRFVEEYDGGRPFYLNLSFIGPHPPLWHPGELRQDPAALPGPLGVPDSQQTRIRRAHYAQKCALIDRYVGRLVAALETKGILDRTVIIFTSDHGDNLGDFGIWDKRFFYENSAGVPFLMAGPGIPREERRNGPRISKALVSLLDIYPTIVHLAGADIPEQRCRAGQDILTPPSGHPTPARDAIFAELGTAAMIRTGNWKLVFDPEQGGVQFLFNLVIDPQEENNLAGVAGYEHVTLDLVQRLLAHRIRLTQYTHIKEEQRVLRVRLRN